MKFRFAFITLFSLGIAGCDGSQDFPVLVVPGATELAASKASTLDEPGGANTAASFSPDRAAGESTVNGSDRGQEITAGTSDVPAFPPQRRSIQKITRAMFAGSADDEPLSVDDLDFFDDAVHDDFADLLAEQSDWPDE